MFIVNSQGIATEWLGRDPRKNPSTQQNGTRFKVNQYGDVRDVSSNAYRKLHRKKKTAEDWYRQGYESFDAGLYAGAQSYFEMALKAGHPQAVTAIELCRQHQAS